MIDAQFSKLTRDIITEENKMKYKVGDLVEFKLDYMGLLRIMNSKYIEKKIKLDS